jgi:hypothetical protein
MWRIETFVDDLTKVGWFHAGWLESPLCAIERQWVLFKSPSLNPLRESGRMRQLKINPSFSSCKDLLPPLLLPPAVQ